MSASFKVAVIGLVVCVAAAFQTDAASAAAFAAAECLTACFAQNPKGALVPSLVCGSDGKTYPSECEVSCAGKAAQQSVTVAHAGRCDSRSALKAKSATDEDLTNLALCIAKQLADYREEQIKCIAQNPKQRNDCIMDATRSAMKDLYPACGASSIALSSLLLFVSLLAWASLH